MCSVSYTYLLRVSVLVSFFFFFQAEDGIRDIGVTGVQTCALPISPEIRNLFKGGSLGQPGSGTCFFNHVGVIEATHSDVNRDAESDAIEAGAQEFEPLEDEDVPQGRKGIRFITEIKDLDTVSKALKKAGWTIISAELRYLAKSFPQLDEPARKQVADFLTALDDHEDVHRVYAALK